MMLTNGLAGFFILDSNTSKIQTGLTKILDVGIEGINVVSINNIPLHLETSQVTISNQLVLKDVRGNVITSTTSVSGNDYTVLIPPGLVFDDPDAYVFSVYANVQSVQSNAVIKTSFQPRVKFSWNDLNSYNRKTFTNENGRFLLDYPTETVISRY